MLFNMFKTCHFRVGSSAWLQLFSLLTFWVIRCSAETDLAFVDYPRNAIAGQSYTITWSGKTKDQPLDITLVRGDSYNFTTVEKLANNQAGGQFVWTVDTALESRSDYVLELDQSGPTNYTDYFTITNNSSSSANHSASGTAAVSTETSSTSGPIDTSGGGSNAGPSDSSLSVGAKAGIGIGAAFGAVLLAGGAFFFGKRAAVRKANKNQTQGLNRDDDLKLVESGSALELSGSEKVELPAEVKPVELPGHTAVELP